MAIAKTRRQEAQRKVIEAAPGLRSFLKKCAVPALVCKISMYTFRYMRSMHSSSSVVCSASRSVAPQGDPQHLVPYYAT